MVMMNWQSIIGNMSIRAARVANNIKCFFWHGRGSSPFSIYEPFHHTKTKLHKVPMPFFI